MKENATNPLERAEPTETGSKEIQQPAPATERIELSSLESVEKIEGHSLPEALRDLGPAFRSYPTWVLTFHWAYQNEKIAAERRQELDRTRDQLQREKIDNAILQERLSSSEQLSLIGRLTQSLGTLAIGLGPFFYKESNFFLSLILVILGTCLFLVGIRAKKPEKPNASHIG